MNLNLPQSLKELSSTPQKNRLAGSWSGAVVVLIIESNFVLIRRSDTMPSHRGQIGFMGGHKARHEIDPIETAKREFAEESGFAESVLEVQGLLNPVITARGKVIIPVVASCSLSLLEFLQRVKSNGEWDNIIIAPIVYLARQELWSFGHYCIDRLYPVYFSPLSKKECIFFW